MKATIREATGLPGLQSRLVWRGYLLRNRYPSLCPHLTCLAVFLVVNLLQISAPQLMYAQSSAPLDTLDVPEPLPPWAAEASMNISRKVLPDVQATTLPKMDAPHKPPRLDDPVGSAYKFYLAQQAAAGGDFNMATERLRQAHTADPGQPQYHWWHAVQALREFDPGSFLWAMPKALRTSAGDLLMQKRMLLMGHQAVILFLGVFWSLLVLAYLGRYWRHLCHDLAALVYRDPSHRLRLWIALVLVGFVLLRPGWLGLLALVSIPLCIQARSRARWPLVAVWVTMILLVIPNWPFLRQAVPAIDPGSETVLLNRAVRMPASGEIRSTLLKQLQVARDPSRKTRLQLALGVQAARNGEYELSSSYFQQILDRENNHVAARTGLANNIYYQGRYDVALQQYASAFGLAPDKGEIPYNMAQAYFKKLFLPEGGETLKQARSLGFDPPAWEDTEGQANEYSPVVYLGLNSDEIQSSTAWEAELYQPLVHLTAWRHWLGSPPVPLFIVLSASLILSLALVFFWSNQKNPRHCQNCGWTICQDCCIVHDGDWLCTRCGETAVRSKSEMVLATLLKNRSRAQGMARVQRLSYLGRLLPGAGHLAVGYMFGGLLRLFLLTIGLFLVLFSWTFDLTARWFLPGLILSEETVHPFWWPMPQFTWPGWTEPTILAGFSLVVIMFVVALFDSAQLRERLPKRFRVSTYDLDRMPSPATRKPA